MSPATMPKPGFASKSSPDRSGIQPISRGCKTDGQSGTGTIAAKPLFSNVKPIGLQWSRSHFMTPFSL